MKTIICVEFDYVIHEPKAPYIGPRHITGRPVRGAIEWLNWFVVDNNAFYELHIFSNRNKHTLAVIAMKKWLLDMGVREDVLEYIQFPKDKPLAYMSIDARAWKFNGVFPTIDDILSFRTWNQGE